MEAGTPRGIEIIPAILPQSFDELERELDRLEGIAPLVQIDLVGKNVLTGRENLPHWDEFDFEIDIMLPQPEREVESAIALGASRVVVHASAESASQALGALQGMRGGDYPTAAGVALGAHDEPSVLERFEGLYDFVQVMGIDHIGRQGEPPDPHHRELALIRTLRAAHPALVIQVDGGAAAHVRELVEAGARRLVVGSAIIQAEDPHAAYKKLYTEANVRGEGS